MRGSCLLRLSEAAEIPRQEWHCLRTKTDETQPMVSLSSN